MISTNSRQGLGQESTSSKDLNVADLQRALAMLNDIRIRVDQTELLIRKVMNGKA